MQRSRCGPTQLFAIQPGVGEASSDSFAQYLVCFRQRCVIEESGLFLSGRSGEDAAHRSATDVEAAGDL